METPEITEIPLPTIKKMTEDDDVFYYRCLYDEKTDFKPQFKVFILGSGLPQLSANDDEQLPQLPQLLADDDEQLLQMTTNN